MTRLLCLLLALLFFAPAAQASVEGLPMSTFRMLPVLNEGRVKPMESLARGHLVQLHGNEKLGKMTAVEWLAECLFQPDVAIKRRFIRLPHPKLVDMLGLEKRKDGLYTYSEVAPALEKKREAMMILVTRDQNTLSHEEHSLLELQKSMQSFTALTQSLMMILPINNEISSAFREQLKIPENGFVSYHDLLDLKSDLIKVAEKTLDTKGNNPDKWTEEEKRAVLVGFYMNSIDAISRGNVYFRILPSYLRDPLEWVSPWAFYNEGHGSPEGAKLLEKWKELVRAYYHEDATGWDDATKQILAFTGSSRLVSNWQLSLESWYHRLNLVMVCTVLYLLALALFAANLFTPHALLKRFAGGVLLSSIALHTVMIVMRILILERPPVSTLYESVLFVGLISAIGGVWISRSNGRPEGRMIGAFLGAFLLAISHLYAQGADTLGVLIAVLNTNFWLATHVICITTGYGACLVAGMLAHVHLARPELIPGKLLRTASLVALLFTATGTILGGIWADQSWGRFWGWDPKENGALLIVLWLVWVLHGRMTEYLSPTRFAALLAFTNIVVAISWFGVNLLNVGLHSYGFTRSAATGLAMFCVVETLIIALLWYRARKRVKANT